VVPLSTLALVKVVDGSSIHCSSHILDAEWSVQGFRFHSSLKLLPLGSFDLILCMDWLEAFSPMKVDWVQKKLSIPYGSRHITLHGLQPNDAQCLLLQLYHIADGTSSSDPVAPEVQQLLTKLSDLFAEPSELPP
jgi:hypothetical protein